MRLPNTPPPTAAAIATSFHRASPILKELKPPALTPAASFDTFAPQAHWLAFGEPPEALMPLEIPTEPLRVTGNTFGMNLTSFSATDLLDTIGGITLGLQQAAFDAKLKAKLIAYVEAGVLSELKVPEAYLLTLVASRQGLATSGGQLNINSQDPQWASQADSALAAFFEGDSGVITRLQHGASLGAVAQAMGLTTSKEAFQEMMPWIQETFGDTSPVFEEILTQTIANDPTLTSRPDLSRVSFVSPGSGQYDSEHLSQEQVAFATELLDITKTVLNEEGQRTGVPFTTKQITEIYLQVLMAARQESTFSNPQGRGPLAGAFQQDDSTGWIYARHSVDLQTSSFLTGINNKVGLLAQRENYPYPQHSLGTAIQETQASAHPTLYDPWLAEATALLSAATGSALSVEDIQFILAGR